MYATTPYRNPRGNPKPPAANPNTNAPKNGTLTNAMPNCNTNPASPTLEAAIHDTTTKTPRLNANNAAPATPCPRRVSNAASNQRFTRVLALDTTNSHARPKDKASHSPADQARG